MTNILISSHYPEVAKRFGAGVLLEARPQRAARKEVTRVTTAANSEKPKSAPALPPVRFTYG
jgi:hypothetical protein